jgi:uncharacterized protein (TIGR00369 family)
MEQADLSHCFGCGPENPVGFHLKKSYDGDRSHIEYEVRPEHTSYPGMMHGGVTCVLLDEVMYHAIARLGIEAVTASLAVNYRRAALVGRHLICEAWIEDREGRRIEVSATIVEVESGMVIAEGRSTFQEVDLARLVGRQ